MKKTGLRPIEAATPYAREKIQEREEAVKARAA
jgi:hypothetical protein